MSDDCAILKSVCEKGHERESMCGVHALDVWLDTTHKRAVCHEGIEYGGQFEPPDFSGACMAPLVSVEVLRIVSFDEWHAEMTSESTSSTTDVD